MQLIKSVLLFICLWLISVLLYTGCSNQYVEKQFNSQKVFQSTLKKALDNRNVNINFLSGKYTSGKVAKINKDSVYWQRMYTEKKPNIIPLSLIKNINYNYYTSHNPIVFNGSVELKNNSIIDIKDATFSKDTVKYYLRHDKLFSKPLNKINSFTFDDHWQGMLQYAFAGMFAGGVIGYKAGSDAGIREREPLLDAVAGGILVGLTGMITGLIIGSPQNYLINNNDSKTLKFLKRFGVLGGITSSTLSGSFSDNRFFSTRAEEQYTFGLYFLWNINNYFKFRPEIIYSIKGGNYNYYNPDVKTLYDYNSNSLEVKLKMIEVPMLFQWQPFLPKSNSIKIIAGPSVNIPLNGVLDEFNIGPMDETWFYYSRKVNTNIYMSLLYGFGIKWDRHFSTEILYDQGLTGLGNAVTSEGVKLKLLQDDFLITTTFSL